MKIPEILTEEDKGKIAEGNEKLKIEDEKDLVLVHKTNYIPVNGIIKSSKDTGVMGNDSFYFKGKEYNVSFPSERETVHFCLNGEVSSHVAGNFDNRKYAIIIPFDKMNMDTIVGGITVDTYTKESVKIPEGSYILCPQDEIEKIKKLTNNLNIVGYEGKSVDGYADMFLSQVLGYKKQEIEQFNWKNQNDDTKVMDIFSELGFKRGTHTGSEEDLITTAKVTIHAICQKLKIIEKEDLITDNQSYEEIMEILERSFENTGFGETRPVDTIFSSSTLTEQLYEELNSVLGIEVSDKLKKTFLQMRENGKKTFDSKYEEMKCNDQIVEQLMTMSLQELQFKSISNRHILELTEYQKEILEKQIGNLSIKSKGYVIKIRTQSPPTVLARSEDARNLVFYNIGNNEHFSFDGFFNNTSVYNANFTTIQDSETIGQYFTRMEECASLIDRCILGENIEFDENGQQKVQKIDEVTEQILNSAVEATEQSTRTGLINEQVQIIKNIELTKSKEQETERDVGEQ